MAGTVTASVIKNDTTSPPAFQNSAGTEIGTLCRAWVNFNGSTASIRASFNVSSITRSSAGVYAVNFTNSLADANYSIVASGSNASSGGYFTYILDSTSVRTASSFNLVTCNAAATALDSIYTSVAIFR